MANKIQSKRPHHVANEIRLKRSQHPGSFAVVEGPNDKVFYGRFFDSHQCKLVAAGWKDNVYEVIRILDEDGFHGALGIVDTDFDHLEGTPLRSSNTVRGDYHDVEAMLIHSPALNHVLREFGSEEKIANFGGADAIRQLLLRAASPLGCLRWHSQRTDLSLRFEGLQLGRVIDETLSVDQSQLIIMVKNHSQRHDLNQAEIELAIQQLEEANHDLGQLCNGHDLVGLLSIGLRGAIGSQQAVRVKSEELERALRLAYEAADFSASGLYKAIQEWEQQNPPFQVLS